ncbi:MAG: hypothetical protein MR380_10920 [Lachnospiraceae bacterium]|nr:hypothetical protein [Lachnospiraceae bacterium]
MNKKYIILSTIVLFNLIFTKNTLFLSASTVQSNSNAPSSLTVIEKEEIQPKADDIRWRYKTIDGKLYKRLYNYSTKTWIGDWILA